jgi:quinol monooxygenase YgiN
MSQIRVIVSMTAESPSAADAAIVERVRICEAVQREEEGCLQYEIFRSVMRPECFTLMELWASEAAFDRHAKVVRPAGSSGAPRPQSIVEMYHVARYRRIDGIWQAEDPEQRMETIRWI